MGHCFRCGAALPAAPPVRCESCRYEHYLNARPTASLVVVDDARHFLALRRARDPRAGLWETPGGFCDGWEEPTDAARREAREELGVDIELGSFVGMYVGEYVFQDEKLPVLDCYWLARLPVGAVLRLESTEATEHAWFALDDPPPLAFDSMDRAVRDAAALLGLSADR
jgi:ADP-ribose pyrophosphatase YjhB (NUDIX family)